MKTRYELETVEEVLYAFNELRSEGESFPYIGSTHTLHIFNGKIKIKQKESSVGGPEYIVSDDVDSDDLIVKLFKSRKIDLSFFE